MSAPRPDPALGIFETLLVVDGEPIALDAHLARMSASARQLFGDAAEARTRGPARALAEARVREAGSASGPRAAGAGRPAGVTDPRPSPALGRLRLAVAPDARGGLDVSATVATVDSAIVFPPLEEAPELVPVTIAGGLGSHKWADRRLVEAAAARAGEGATEGAGTLPLIVDQDGSVLEAERASVFAVIDGALFTPPDDGRILPGVTRARVSELARGLGLEVREAGLSLAALADASEVFLTGSVRGIEPVRTTGAPSVTERLATELRSRWLRPAA